MSAPAVPQRLDLPIEGMTCASCASRIERKLNTLEGVEATVNYATERATVSFDGERVTPRQLVAAVEAAGYAARLPSPDPSAGCAARLLGAARPLGPRAGAGDDPGAAVRRLAMALARARHARSCCGPGWPFHRAAWRNLRHGAATMDTLISLGTLAAWGWSVVALCFLGAGRLEMRMPFELITSRDAASDSIYLEVASVVTTFILRRPLLRGARQAPLGRRAAGPARARRQGRRGARPRTGASGASPSASCASATASSCGPARRSPPTASSRRAPRRSTRRS